MLVEWQMATELYGFYCRLSLMLDITSITCTLNCTEESADWAFEWYEIDSMKSR